jgi:N-acetylglucosaminyl-diphospho-decaprenol L-rhamnosyltransferase
MKPVLDALIVNFNTSDLLGNMFSALQASAWPGEVHCFVVDNASSDDSIENLQENYPDVLLVVNQNNVGFGRANNQLLEYLQGGYTLLLNTDAFVSPDTLSKTIDYMETHPDCGVLGVRLIGRDGDLQPSCRFFPTPFNVFLTHTGLARFFPWARLVDDMNWDHSSVRECDWVPGCYYLIRREVIDQVGLFDPRYFLYYEEVDHCKRVKEAGWKVVYYSHTSVVHIGGESAKSAGELSTAGRQLSALQIESEMLYFRKHHGFPGLAWHMFLVTLGDLILSVKHVLKRRGLPAMRSNWHHMMLSWRLLFQTRLATRPTR